MSAPEVNIPLLRKAVEWAEAEATKPPELCEWNQGWYITPAAELRRATECGTCYCIAGYVAHQSSENVTGIQSFQVAADLLGLNTTEALQLFNGSNTIIDVRRIAEDIAGERL